MKLALEHGADNVTVEDICDAANISKRTFFNYVETKEAAIYGPPPLPLTEEEKEEFASTKKDNVLRAALESFFAHIALDDASREIMQLRKRLIKEKADHITPFGNGLFALIHSISGALTMYFDKWPEEKIIEDEARVTASLAFTAVQIGFFRWLNSKELEPQDCIAYAVNALTDISRVIEK